MTDRISTRAPDPALTIMLLAAIIGYAAPIVSSRIDYQLIALRAAVTFASSTTVVMILYAATAITGAML